MATSDIIKNPEFQEMPLEDQRDFLHQLYTKNIGKEYTDMTDDDKREFIHHELRVNRPASTIESLTAPLPAIGPLLRQWVYDRPANREGFIAEQESQQIDEIDPLTGQVKPKQPLSDQEIAIAESMADVMLLLGPAKFTAGIGIAGKTIKSMIGRELIEGGIYSGLHIPIDKPEDVTMENLAGNVVLGGIGAGIIGKTIQFLNPKGTLISRMHDAFGSKNTFDEFLGRLKSVESTGDFTILSEIEVDTALRTIGSRQRGGAAELRDVLTQVKSARAEQVARQGGLNIPSAQTQDFINRMSNMPVTPEKEDFSQVYASHRQYIDDAHRQQQVINTRNRTTGGKNIPNAQTQDFINRMNRAYETVVPGEDYTKYYDNLVEEHRISSEQNIARQQQIRAGKPSVVKPATQDFLNQMNTASRNLEVPNDMTAALEDFAKVPEVYQAQRMASIARTEEARVHQLATRFSDDMMLRKQAGLYSHLSNDELKLIDPTDYRATQEIKIRDIEKRVMNRSITPPEELIERLRIGQALAFNRGIDISDVNKQLQDILTSRTQHSMASLDNLSLEKATALSQDFRVAGFQDVRINQVGPSDKFDLSFSIGQSDGEKILMGLYTTNSQNKGVLDITNRTYNGLTPEEHKLLGNGFGIVPDDIAKFNKFVEQTFAQMDKNKIVQPVSVEQLGVRSIEEQVLSKAKSAQLIRTDIGQMLPPPRPYLVGEPVNVNINGTDTFGVVDAIAIDKTGKQSVVVTLTDGQNIHVPDTSTLSHRFSIHQSTYTPSHDGLIRNLNSVDPQPSDAIANIKVNPGEINKGVELLNKINIKARAVARSDGTYLDIDGIVKQTFNTREAEQIVENLLKSKAAQLEYQNRMGGKECM